MCGALAPQGRPAIDNRRDTVLLGEFHLLDHEIEVLGHVARPDLTALRVHAVAEVTDL